MQSITVSMNGDKKYSTVMQGVTRPSKVTRERDPAKAKYDFNNMKDNDFLYCADEKTRNAITQAFKGKMYVEAAKRGYLFTANLKKHPDLMKALNVTEGFGVWFTEYTEAELTERAKEGKA